jgi:hypothetical protein
LNQNISWAQPDYLEMARARKQTPSRFVLSRKTRCCVQWSRNFCQRACAFKNIARTATATVQSFLHWQKMFDCRIDNGNIPQQFVASSKRKIHFCGGKEKIILWRYRILISLRRTQLIYFCELIS